MRATTIARRPDSSRAVRSLTAAAMAGLALIAVSSATPGPALADQPPPPPGCSGPCVSLSSTKGGASDPFTVQYWFVRTEVGPCTYDTIQISWDGTLASTPTVDHSNVAICYATHTFDAAPTPNKVGAHTIDVVGATFGRPRPVAATKATYTVIATPPGSTAKPSVAATAAPTTTPAATPTAEPTATLAPTPTAVPTVAPTASPITAVASPISAPVGTSGSSGVPVVLIGLVVLALAVGGVWWYRRSRPPGADPRA